MSSFPIRNKMNTMAFIMCGGQSNRMGIDKSTLEYRGKTFLAHCKQVALQANINAVYTVGRRHCDINDIEPFKGPAHAAISAICSPNLLVSNNQKVPASILVLMPVDMPLLTPKLLLYLINEAHCRQTSCHFDDQWFPLVIVHPERYISHLKPLLVKRHPPSMKTLARVCNAQCVAVPSHHYAALTNVNTPQELNAIR